VIFLKRDTFQKKRMSSWVKREQRSERLAQLSQDAERLKDKLDKMKNDHLSLINAKATNYVFNSSDESPLQHDLNYRDQDFSVSVTCPLINPSSLDDQAWSGDIVVTRATNPSFSLPLSPPNASIDEHYDVRKSQSLHTDGHHATIKTSIPSVPLQPTSNIQQHDPSIVIFSPNLNRTLSPNTTIRPDMMLPKLDKLESPAVAAVTVHSSVESSPWVDSTRDINGNNDSHIAEIFV
jgi:hypothetical protein